MGITRDYVPRHSQAPLEQVAIAGAGACSCIALFALRGFSPENVHWAAFIVLLTAMASIDAKSRIIPDALLVAALAVRLVYVTWLMAAGWRQGVGVAAQSMLGGVSVGAGIFLLSALIAALLGREGMGGGDIKLFAVVGCYFGVWRGFGVVVLACALGAAASLAASLAKRDGGVRADHTFAFAPAIALACVIMILLLS